MDDRAPPADFGRHDKIGAQQRYRYFCKVEIELNSRADEECAREEFAKFPAAPCEIKRRQRPKTISAMKSAAIIFLEVHTRKRLCLDNGVGPNDWVAPCLLVSRTSPRSRARCAGESKRGESRKLFHKIKRGLHKDKRLAPAIGPVAMTRHQGFADPKPRAKSEAQILIGHLTSSKADCFIIVSHLFLCRI